jgi:hypothetical protein
MNIKIILSIILLVILGAGLGVLSAQWMPSLSSMKDVVLYSDIDPSNNSTGFFVVTISSGSSYEFGDAVEIKHLSPIELIEDERREAINIALGDPKVQKEISGRKYEIKDVRSMPVLYNNEKNMNIWVWIDILNESDDEIYNTIVAAVNLNEKKVIEVITDQIYMLWIGKPPIMQPIIEPLSAQEEEHARDIVLSNANIKELLLDKEYNISRVISLFDTEDRYASVHIDILNESTNMTAYMTVEVNLNESTVNHINYEMIRKDDMNNTSHWKMSSSIVVIEDSTLH